MKTFEVGKSYYARNIYDPNTVFVYTVIARTPKYVTLRDKIEDINIGKRKIYIENDEEYFCPMSTKIKASNLYEL